MEPERALEVFGDSDRRRPAAISSGARARIVEPIERGRHRKGVAALDNFRSEKQRSRQLREYRFYRVLPEWDGPFYESFVARPVPHRFPWESLLHRI